MPVGLENSPNRLQKTLLLDTGSEKTTVDFLDSLTLQLQPIKTNTSMMGLRGNYSVDTAPVGALTVGSINLPGFPIDYSADGKGLMPATLGMNVLWRFLILMDFPAKKMYLQPTRDAVPTITFNAVPTIMMKPQAAPPSQTPAPQPHP